MTFRLLAWKTEQMVEPLTETRSKWNRAEAWAVCLSLGQGDKGDLDPIFGHVEFEMPDGKEAEGERTVSDIIHEDWLRRK